MKNLKKILFFIFIFFIALFSFLSFFGIQTRWGDTIYNHFKGINTLKLDENLSDETEIVISYENMDDDQEYEVETILKERCNMVNIEQNTINIDRDKKIIKISFPNSLNKPFLDSYDIAPYLVSNGNFKIMKTTENEMNALFSQYMPQNNDGEILATNSDLKNEVYRYIVPRRLKGQIKENSPIPSLKVDLYKDSMEPLRDLYEEAVQTRREYLEVKKQNDRLERIIKKQKEEEKEEKGEEEKEKKENKEEEKNKEKTEEEKELEEGRKQEKELEQELTKKNIKVVVDDKTIYTGSVIRPFELDESSENSLFLTNPSLSSNDFFLISNLLKSNNLPIKLNLVSVNNLTPRMGNELKNNILIFAVIVILLITLFLVLKFKILGAIASVNMIVQIAFVIAFFTGFLSFIPGYCFTLPAFLGLLVSLLFGICCFCLIARKLTDRLKNSINIELCVKQVYKNEIKTIISSNVLIALVSAILMGMFSATPEIISTMFKLFNILIEPNSQNSIFSFSYALLLGTIGNLLFQILGTKILLMSAVNLKFFRNLKLYGGKTNEIRE